MARLIPAILGLRRDPRILKLPPYLSLLCILVGIGWLLVLPLDDYSRNTYISENALLPAQVHTYFGGSEHTVFRAYRHEVAALGQKHISEVAEHFAEIFSTHGLKVGRQRYQYEAAGRVITGENVYGILQGPRADATEAVVLMAGWINMENWLNQSGVALVLAMARYMKRWSLWSKDIIFLISGDSTAGPQAWVDAYHDMHGSTVDSLPVKAGALQGAIALDYTAGTGGHRYDKIMVHFDGVNGQLPNLDLVNTVIKIAKDQVGMDSIIQHNYKPSSAYSSRLETLARGVLSQSRGLPTGPHSCFVPYHVDAVTVQTVGDGWHDEMSLGRLVEGSFRSLNNLLEHLHQSFFFYLLLQPDRFVSIGTYLPAAMLVAVNFTITSIALWLLSGRADTSPKPVAEEIREAKPSSPKTTVEHAGQVAVVPAEILETHERALFVPVLFVAATYALGFVPLYILNTAAEASLTSLLIRTTLTSTLLPLLSALLLHSFSISAQELTLIQCFSLLLTGILLATLSTLNFSLGLLAGLLASPASFVRPWHNAPRFCVFVALLLVLASPPAFVWASCAIPNGVWTRGWAAVAAKIASVLGEYVVAWRVNGVFTAGVVCLVWWPAWYVAATVVWSGAFAGFLKVKGKK